jgi:hypothetical protein
MKTYSEVNGQAKFNWREALSAATINWSDLTNRAGGWVTCACGNQCSIIERRFDGQPVDVILSRLSGGYGFYGAVQSRNADLALHFLDLIETHSAKLISKALPEAIRRLKEKKVGLKTRQAREIKDMKARHALEAKTLKTEIEEFNKNFPGSIPV